MAQTLLDDQLPTHLVGKPWEILRTTHLTPAHPHTIDIYGKSGGAAGYVSQIGVIDQYGVGVVVMSAGPGDKVSILYPAVLGTLMPAVEEAARAQARKYTGEWSTTSTRGLNSSASIQDQADDNVKSDSIHLTLVQDTRGGLKLTSLTHTTGPRSPAPSKPSSAPPTHPWALGS